MQGITIEAVNRSHGTILDDLGTIWVVREWLDCDGEPCAPQDATYCFAFDGYNWLEADIDGFGFETRH